MADCLGPLGVIGCAGEIVVGGAVDNAVDSGANSLGEAMMGGWDSLFKQFLTSWLDVGLLVSLDGDAVTWLTDQLQNISVFFAIIGIMISAVWTMVHFRGDKAASVGKSLLTVVLVTALGTAVVQLVITIGDQFSDWVLESAGVTVDGMGNLGTAVTLIGPGLAIIAGIFGIIATAIQWLIMLVRATILPLLVAVWPLVASASMIQGSEQAFSKLTKWMVAFILYKPVAAIVYAFAWRLKSGDDGIGGVLNGLLLLVLAVVALPALMRLISPGTTALGGAAGGSIALAAGAAVGSAAVSAGAAIMTGGGSAAATAGTAGGGAATSGTAGGGSAMKGDGAAATADGASTTPSTTGTSTEAPSAPAGGTSEATRSTAEGTISSSDTSEGQGASGSTGTAGTAGGAAPAAEGTTSDPSGGTAAGSVASETTPASDSATSLPPSSGTSGGSTRGGAAARSAIESAGNSVADGAKDVNGEDVIGG